MSFIKHLHTSRNLLTVILLVLCLTPVLALGGENDETLDLYSAFQESSSSASRAPKPLSQTAENITIINAREIEALNAHTLADVLETVPGLQVSMNGGPGSQAQVTIQGASPVHVRVLLDGAPLNNISNVADIAMIPAQIIERIEIVKGTASSSWGLALGGVINVITKQPDQRQLSGSVSSSFGEHSTYDSSGEASGTTGRLGYYLFGKYLGSTGAVEHRSVYNSNAYGKLTYDLPGQGQIWGSILYGRSIRFDNFATEFDFKEQTSHHDLYATLGMTHPLTDQLSIELNGFFAARELHDDVTPIVDPGAFHQLLKARDRVGGAGAKLIWHGDQQLIVGGIEFQHDNYKGRDLLQQSTIFDHSMDRYGFYLNDTISFGKLSIIPGARFDRTAEGNQFSPSLGATFQLNSNNLLRAYAGKGYSFTNREIDWKFQKIWTAQLGFESSSVPYLWFKGSLFRNETWNVQDLRNLDPLVPERRVALGAEIEFRTTPVFNTSLGGGYTFVDTTRSNDGSQVYTIPRHTVQLSLRYDDKTFRGILTGRHIYWNGVPEFNGKYGGMIWDLHLGATIVRRENTSLDIFFSGRNLFNGSQFSDELQPNAGRWFEGGLRVRF